MTIHAETGETRRWKKAGIPRVLYRVLFPPISLSSFSQLADDSVSSRDFSLANMSIRTDIALRIIVPVRYEAEDCNKLRLYVRKRFAPRNWRVLSVNLRILAARRVPV